MPTRRQIRETTVQLIYSTEFNGCNDPTEAREAFWSLVQEKDHQSLQEAQLKAVQHLAEGRAERRSLLEKKTTEAHPHLSGVTETEALRIALEKTLTDESKWLKLLEKANRLRKSSTESDRESFGSTLDDLLALDRSISERRADIKTLMADLPGFRPRLEGVTSALVKLQRISDRIQVIAHPESYSDQPTVAHLKDAHVSVSALRTEVEDLVSKVSAKQEKIDQTIATVVENFSPERIDPVDRCVLRLGLYEILFCDDLPNPVAINEALDIVKLYGTTDSHRFVNGILDKIAKQTGVKNNV